MHLTQAARRTSMAALVLGLSACSGPTLIGAPGSTLMNPGEGLVVGSVSFVTHMPEGMHYRFHYVSDYESIDGKKTNFSLGTIDRVPRHFSKVARSPQATPPMLMMYSAKPGKYRLQRTDLVGEGQFSFWPKDSREFDVVPGQVTYVGNTVVSYTTAFRGIGVLTPTNVHPSTRDDFAADMAELKSVEPRLETVQAVNALAR